MKGITIPDGVTRIGDEAFAFCESLEGITIPSGVTSIGKDAFNGCSGALKIYCYPGSYAEEYAKANNIPYERLTNTRVLEIRVFDANGSLVTDGFTVTWYDAEGNTIGTGAELLGADADAPYQFAVTLGDVLSQTYQQPDFKYNMDNL